MLGWLLVTLLAWCVTSAAAAFGLGWLIRRHPPRPRGDNAPRE